MKNRDPSSARDCYNPAISGVQEFGSSIMPVQIIISASPNDVFNVIISFSIEQEADVDLPGSLKYIPGARIAYGDATKQELEHLLSITGDIDRIETSRTIMPENGMWTEN